MSHLKQCLSFADNTSLHSPVLRVACPGLRTSLRQLCSQLPPNSRVLKASFEVKTDINHLEAITYVDGDGGYITTDFVPGLYDYVQQLDHSIQLQNIQVGGRSHTLVEFREAFHDAVELSHEYKFTDEDTPPTALLLPAGLKALASARRSVGLSKKTTIVVRGVDESGLRLLVEVVTELDTDTAPVANGLRCIREGYSYAATYNQSQVPQCYREAEDDARSNCRGVWQLKEYHNILQMEKYKPWTLKRALCAGEGYGRVGEDFEDDDGARYDFLVKASSEHLNEANLYVAQSTIENAGLGLFLLPPKPGASRKVIPAGTHLCTYAHCIRPGESDETHGDYYVFREGGSYDAKIIDGENHGRFANQGGLEEGTKKMCELATLPVGFNWIEVNREVEQKVDVTFKTVGRTKTLKLATTKVITMPAGSSACKEVFVDYGLQNYWIPYILRNRDAIGHDHWMVKRTLWLLLSSKSNQAGTVWARGQLSLHNIESDRDVVDDYLDADCPVLPPPSRRTRRTHV